MSDTIEARFSTVLNTNERLKRELSAAKAEILRLRKVLVLLEDAIEEALADPKPNTGEDDRQPSEQEEGLDYDRDS